MAAIAIRDESISDVATSVGCSYQHLYYALHDKRDLSKRLLAALRIHFGDAAWMFVMGRSDVLSPLIRAA